MAQLDRRFDMLDLLTRLTHQTSADGLLFADEYKNRLQVLRRLNYIDQNNVVNLKGKVACEICHMEMLITELMLDNHFEGKSCAEIAAILSALTCQYSCTGTDNEDKFHNPRMAEVSAVLNFLKCML